MILWLTAAFAACDKSTDNAALARGVDAAIVAFQSMEDANFASAREAVIQAVPCLAEPLKPEVAAAVHRIRGLNAFLADDSLTGQLYFAAARSIDPSYRFPEDVAPEGHPLQQDYLALDTSADQIELLPELTSGSLFVNGRRTRERSKSYPILFQLVDAENKVVTTTFLDAGMPLPVEPGLLVAVKTPPPDPGPERPTKPRKKGPNLPVLLGGAALGAVAGGLAVGNRLSFAGYNKYYATLDATSSSEDLATYDKKRGTTNLLGFTATGVGVAAIGLGTASLFVSGRF